MAVRRKRNKIDIEKEYPLNKFIEKLRRLADCLEQGKKFRIQINGVRLIVPTEAIINIEHEKGEGKEEIEFQLKWQTD
jgi:amphi-Trp domain-containing protein